MSSETVFTKENLDYCLRELGKEFRKLNGKTMPAEIILIGGASVLANYGFRDATYDLDAFIQASSVMKEAINRVGDKLGLPNGWLNSDFVRTKSYSPNLRAYSVYYKTFSNVLTVRTISGEYLVAMKLMSKRQYKNDISDIVGILWEQKERGEPITLQKIDTAVSNLYGSWSSLPQDARQLVQDMLEEGKLEKLYTSYRQKELENRKIMLKFEEKYPGVTTKDNAEDILKKLKSKKRTEYQR